MQPELFQELETQPKARRFQPPLFPHRFLRVRVAYEDVIFVFLSLILVLLAGFCIGVERGKKLRESADALPLQAVVSSHDASAPLKESLTVEGTAPVQEAKKETRSVARNNEKYAIQLASFLDNQSAQLELQRLLRKGTNAQVIKQGRYFELRVVGFQSRSEAQLSLSSLKKVYRDGFIKRVS